MSGYERRLYTLEEAAAHLGVTPGTLRNQIYYGRMEPYQRQPHYLFTASDIVRYRRERQSDYRTNIRRAQGGKA